MMLGRTLLACTLALAALAPAAAQNADGRNGWPGAGQLFVGTNDQPFDRADHDRILLDIARLKAAGMKVVRMGDLSWDAFEPAEGKFDFNTPDGVFARAVNGRVLYVNTTGDTKKVAIEGAMRGVLSGKPWTDTLRLEPQCVDLLER